MPTALEVDQAELVQATAEELKELEEIEPPQWSVYTKNSPGNQRPPEQEDWWYSRTASILRRVNRDGPVGVRKLRNAYGTRDRRDTQPEKFRPAGGSSVRKPLQQLEEAGLVKKTEEGREVTDEGRSFLDGVAEEV